MDEELRCKEMECKFKYAKLCHNEESFYKQKSRVHWLKEGDKNTSYFFKKVNGNRASNKVLSIFNE